MKAMDGIIDLCSELTETSVDYGIRCVGVLGVSVTHQETGKEYPLRFTIAVEPPVFGETAYPPEDKFSTSVVHQLKSFEELKEKEG